MTEHGPHPLEDYHKSAFKTPDVSLPLMDAFHATWWRKRFEEHGGGAQRLVETLSQFQVSIAAGACHSESYTRLILQAQPASTSKSALELFAAPDSVHWRMVDHPAGGLPVVTFEDRADFELAFRALGARCEPVPIGENVHALYVGGLPNPVRVREMKSAFIASGNDSRTWPQEMKRRMKSDGTSFHDRLILLHTAPYGGLQASDVGDQMSEAGWLEASLQLRLEHEFTHHATHRLLGSYRLHVHDEMLADLMGFTKALGRFEAELFLRALGIDGDRIRPDARLSTYTVDLAEEALPRLVEILRVVAEKIEAISSIFVGTSESNRLRSLVALSQIDLHTLADDTPERVISSILDFPFDD